MPAMTAAYFRDYRERKAAGLIPPRVSLEERFWSHVDRAGGPESCWLWQGSRNQGYGQFMVKRGVKPARAHRLSYEWAKGPIPEGLHLDHLCRNRACVNPDHLEPVTVKVNVGRGLNGVLRTTCAQGHLFDSVVHRSNGTSQRTCSICVRAARERAQAKAKEIAHLPIIVSSA